ncbi:SPFH domain-containing protein [Nocardia vinacea]|uniref:SPFH domain-containing protein n=1 Tax=Nocardia vinacea TaxID=96468 RepID=A0ABZ1YHS1_9NOCA|nr:SPFH domain-containing protein [Nocardia vinacea]
MPFLFLTFVILGLATGCIGIGSSFLSDRDARGGARFITVVLAALALLALAGASTTIVSTRSVGIVTSFGKPTGTLSNGIHLIKPWQKVPELSGVIHTDSQTGAFDSNGKCSGGTAVRLANNSTACVDNTIRWRIVPTSADELFRDYQNDDRIRDSLVTRELNAILNTTFATYNPLALGSANGPGLDQLSTTITAAIKEKIGRQIEVLSVIVSLVHFDGQTQERINAFQAQVASTRIAEESQRTATAQAQANRQLADSVSHDPNVLVARCLELVAAGKGLPAGFQCWPGTGLATTIPAR